MGFFCFPFISFRFWNGDKFNDSTYFLLFFEIIVLLFHDKCMTRSIITACKLTTGHIDCYFLLMLVIFSLHGILKL